MNSKKKISSPNSTCNSILVLNQPCCQSRRDLPRRVYVWVKEAELASLFVSCARNMHQMGASHMRPTPPLPWHTHAAAFVHISQMLGGVHQRGGRRGARRAAHREQAGPEPFGRSLLKLSSLCTCAGRQERAGSSLRGHAIVGANGISGQVFEHRAVTHVLRSPKVFRSTAPRVGFGLLQVPSITYRWSLRHGGCTRDRHSRPEADCA